MRNGGYIHWRILRSADGRRQAACGPGARTGTRSVSISIAHEPRVHLDVSLQPSGGSVAWRTDHVV